MIRSIKDGKIEDAKLLDIVKSCGILFDKHRLLGDKSTQNIEIHSHAKLITELWDGLLKEKDSNETEEIEGEKE